MDERDCWHVGFVECLSDRAASAYVTGAAMKDAKWTTRPLTPEENERLNRNIAQQKIERAERELEGREEENSSGGLGLLLTYFAIAGGAFTYLLWRAFH